MSYSATHPPSVTLQAGPLGRDAKPALAPETAPGPGRCAFQGQPVLEICRGLPGSGKTTYARKAVAQHDPEGGLVRVNRDDYRRMLFDPAYQGGNPARERAVTAAAYGAIRWLLNSGTSVICDDTNLRDDYLRELTGVAISCGAEIRMRDEFLSIPIETCIARQAKRPPEERVPAKVIRRMWLRFTGQPTDSAALR